MTDARLSVVVPAHGQQELLDECVAALVDSSLQAFECIVVDDGSEPPLQLPAHADERFALCRREQRGGPAAARNTGSEQARADILVFVDADVAVNDNTLEQIEQAMSAEDAPAALFGSYDASPAAPQFVSAYRNIYHHWVHQQGQARASTFWSGLGAVRRRIFEDMGGFNANYNRPSIEDIEFGYRMRAAGHPVALEKHIQARHLKRWTLRSVVHADLFFRAIPWMRLLLRTQQRSSDLNLNWRARLATASAGLMCGWLFFLLLIDARSLLPFLALMGACLLARVLDDLPRLVAVPAVAVTVLGPAAWLLAQHSSWWAWPPLALATVILLMQSAFYRLVIRLRGPGFAVACWPMQCLFFTLCALSLPIGLLGHWKERFGEGSR